MIPFELHTYKHEDGAYQRTLTVRPEKWEDLNFCAPEYSPEAFERLYELYRDFTVPTYKPVFGTIVMYSLPEGVRVTFPEKTEEYGELFDDYAKVTAAFRTNISLKKGKFVFADSATESFFNALKNKGLLKIVKGDRKSLRFMPVGRDAGFLSGKPEGSLKASASFFTMDVFDVPSVYDRAGVPVGLCVKDGNILNPPLYGRDCLTVRRDGQVKTEKIFLKDLTVRIGQRKFRHGEGVQFMERSESVYTPKKGADLVIIKDRLIAKKIGGKTEIPAGGFVIHCEYDPGALVETKVTYEGLEDVIFAVQGGTAAVNAGVPSKSFTSPFYNFKQFWKPSYPPVFYPLNFAKDRAPRMMIGEDAGHKPVLIWLEGAGKFKHHDAKESAGSSLAEANRIAEILGMVNGIHLDGGGSAEIIADGKRHLKVSDRDPESYEEKERAIPLGLWIQ